jgi:hypothetical protein
LTDVYTHVFTTLSTLGYSVREQGTYGQDEVLPETHITYNIADQDDISHADNRPTATMTRIQVALYSKDPAIVQQANKTLKDLLLPAGFLRAGGRNLPFDADTGHYGYISTYNFYDLEG